MPDPATGQERGHILQASAVRDGYIPDTERLLRGDTVDRQPKPHISRKHGLWWVSRGEGSIGYLAFADAVSRARYYWACAGA